MTNYAYHASTNCFYLRTDIVPPAFALAAQDKPEHAEGEQGLIAKHAEKPLPAGYAEVSAEEHAALFAAQSQGKCIQADPAGTGRPVALAPPAPTPDELLQGRAHAVRDERDRRIFATDYLMAADYPLDEEQRAQWTAYRQALRGLPQAAGFPWDGGAEGTPWPVKPVQ